MYSPTTDRREESSWERYGAADTDAGLTADGIEALLGADGITDDETCSTLLTLAGYKDGTYVDWSDTEGYEDLVATVNAMGGTVYAREQDGIYGGRTMLIITRDDRYDVDEVAEAMGSGTDRDGWLGSFLGFPGEDIEAWLDPDRETATTKQLVQRYGDDLSEEERADVERFNHGTFADDHRGLERALDRARTRRNAFEAVQEAYGVDLAPLHADDSSDEAVRYAPEDM